MPTMPTAMPGISMPQIIVMHMPTPNTMAPNTPKIVVAIALPLKTIAGLPSILRRMGIMASKITAPTMPITMPCVIAPHSGSSAMHMPRAKTIPPTVLIIRVIKSFFFILKNLHYILSCFSVLPHLMILL